MPVVPLATAPSVAPSPNSGLPYQNATGATPDAFGAQVGAAQQGLGKGIETLGDVLAKHTLRMQEELNVSHAEELFLNKGTELATLSEQYKTLEGASRVAALPKFMEDAAALRAKGLEEAPNGDVKKKFDQLFTRRLGFSLQDAGTLAAQANRQYRKETNAAVRANTLNQVALNADDDKRFESELAIGKETFQNSDDYKGASPEVRAQHDEAYVDAAWSSRLASMARNNPLRARELLKDAPVSGLARIKLQDNINQQIINVDTQVKSDEIIQSGALISPDLVGKIKKFEGYKETPYSDFKQTSIGYGTKYQPGDENIPKDRRKAVFEQRMMNELGRAAGIVDTFAPGLPSGTRDALISLTYNAGSGWTSSGLGAKIRAGDYEGAKANFTAYNMAGGQVNTTLVGRRADEVSWFGGDSVDTGIDSGTRLAKALDRAKEAAVKVFPDDPGNQAKYLDALQSRIKTDSAILTQASKDMQLELKNTVQSELVDPNSAVTSYDKLSPKAQQAYDLSSPALQQSAQRQMRANATRDVPYTAERRSLGDTLQGEAINEPDKFMARDISDLDLTRPQKSQFLKIQADRKALLAKGEKLSTAIQTVQADLNDAGIYPSKTDRTKNEEFNKYSGILAKALDDLENEKKRPLYESEKRELAKSLLKNVVLDPGYKFVPFSGEEKRAYELKIRAGSEAADYAKIPPGSLFTHTDGTVRRKPL